MGRSTAATSVGVCTGEAANGLAGEHGALSVGPARTAAWRVACGNFKMPRCTRCHGKAHGLGRCAASEGAGGIGRRGRRGAGAAGAGYGAAHARFRRDRFILGHFDHDFLPIFELKCIRW
jgi:hypothetical protein